MAEKKQSACNDCTTISRENYHTSKNVEQILNLGSFFIAEEAF